MTPTAPKVTNTATPSARAGTYALAFVLGLAGCLAGFRFGWRFVPDDELLGTILESSLSLSGITIAVVGLLLTLYVTQQLGVEGKKKYVFMFLIPALTLASLLGFTTSLVSLAVLGSVASSRYREVVPYLFLAVLYTISGGIVIAVVETFRK